MDDGRRAVALERAMERLADAVLAVIDAYGRLAAEARTVADSPSGDPREAADAMREALSDTEYDVALALDVVRRLTGEEI